MCDDERGNAPSVRARRLRSARGTANSRADGHEPEQSLRLDDRDRSRLVVASALVLTQAGYVASGLQMVSAPPSVYKSLLGAPRLVLWKVGLWGRMLVRPDAAKWVRTARNADDATPDATADDEGTGR